MPKHKNKIPKSLPKVRILSSGSWQMKNNKSITVLDEPKISTVTEVSVRVEVSDYFLGNSCHTSDTQYNDDESFVTESIQSFSVLEELPGETIDEQQDMRHKLTPWERDIVFRLKKACDMEEIKYNHIFELAKYIYQAKYDGIVKEDNPDADIKLMNHALTRIRGHREWEESIDYPNFCKDDRKFDVLKKFIKAAPGWFVVRYTRDVDGKHCVGRHSAFAPATYIRGSDENVQIFLSLEHWNFDIAAYDMEEIRKGSSYFLISEDKVTISRAYKGMQTFVAIKNKFFSDTQSYCISKVYCHGPSMVSAIIRAIIKILPKKIKEVLTVVGHMSDLDPCVTKQRGAEADNVDSVLKWFNECDKAYNETAEKLKL